jgi:hypothetical protein
MKDVKGVFNMVNEYELYIDLERVSNKLHFLAEMLKEPHTKDIKEEIVKSIKYCVSIVDQITGELNGEQLEAVEDNMNIVDTCNAIGLKPIVIIDEKTEWDNMPCFGSLIGRCYECKEKSYSGYRCIVNQDGVFVGYDKSIPRDMSKKIKWE